MIKKLIKNTIKFAAKQLAEAIVEEQIRQGLYVQNNRMWLDNPYYIPSTNPQDVIKPFEITWSDSHNQNLVDGNTVAN